MVLLYLLLERPCAAQRPVQALSIQLKDMLQIGNKILVPALRLARDIARQPGTNAKAHIELPA
ncbi:hypothetical protein PPUJ20028_31710 [Pseudomonas putida]|uniref:Uncharacterized protein n=1 Tax=Pseudomonas putida TaxID=303 RepID=A0AA37VVC6_PSEPU|nr:hypothetical protein PPUJ20028_31710 [Pseudomonas putida]GLO35045.1 hypothetical protein PPUN14671_18780 [Pseudomonas putida]